MIQQNPLNRLRQAYWIALGLIALLILLSQFIIHRVLQDQQADSRVINISGRQRMLSQKLVKTVLLLDQASQPSETDQYLEGLRKTFSLWESAHLGLLRGNEAIGIPSNYNSPRVEKLFDEIKPYFHKLSEAIKQLLSSKQLSPEIRQVVLGSEQGFLELMDKITFQYDQEAKEKVLNARYIEYIIGGFTLLLLLFELLFIYRPVIKQVNTLFITLLDSYKELENKGKQYETLFNTANDAIFVADIHTGLIVDANVKAEELLKKDRKEIMGLHQRSIHPPEDPDMAHKAFEEDVRADGNLRVMEVLNSDGNRVTVEISSSKFTSTDGQELMFGIFRDLSERLTQEALNKKYQKELEHSITKLSQAQNQLIKSEKLSALGHLMAGIAHEINTPVGAIQASAEMLNRQLDTILPSLPKQFVVLTPKQVSFFLELQELIKVQGEVETLSEIRKWKRAIRLELEIKKVDGASTLAEQLVELGIYHPKPAFLQKLTESDFKETLTLFHKFYNIKFSTQTILSALQKASKTLFALKHFKHIDHTEQAVVIDLAKSIETVLVLFQNKLKTGVEVIQKYAPQVQMLGFPDQLEQVWNNLIMNALQAIDYRGTLTIHLSQQEEFVEVAFQDNGAGIPQEIQDRIFEPFFTTKPVGEGSGLGLDIVKRVVTKHKGEVLFESKVGEGTTFRVIFPKNFNMIDNSV